MNYMDASSPVKRAEVLQWFEYLATRLDHEKGVILLVMQRLHVDDVVASLLVKGGWHYVSIPLIATEAQSYDCGGFTYHRAAGKLLHAEYFSAAAVEKRRKEIGEQSFQAQYQQEPIAGSDLMVPFDRFLPCHETWPQALVIQSWDVATTLNGGDYSACSTWHCSGSKACLVDIHRAQVDFPTLKDRIRARDKMWKPNMIIIEKDGIGKSLVQDLRRSGMKHVQAIKAPSDKTGRLQLSSLRFADGLVFIRPGISGLNELRTEWNAFPEGKFDDQVDSITLFLSRYHDCMEFVRKQPNLRLQQSSGNLITVINIPYPTRMPDLW